jgi:hypothetical protein
MCAGYWNWVCVHLKRERECVYVKRLKCVCVCLFAYMCMSVGVCECVCMCVWGCVYVCVAVKWQRRLRCSLITSGLSTQSFKFSSPQLYFVPRYRKCIAHQMCWIFLQIFPDLQLCIDQWFPTFFHMRNTWHKKKILWNTWDWKIPLTEHKHGSGWT